MIDDLDSEAIDALLANARASLGRPTSVSRVTGSTNDDAKLAARAGAPHGAAFLADCQTGGRGRLGRTWYSPPGENLYASFVIRVDLPARQLPTLALAAGLAVADVVRDYVEPGRVPPEEGRVSLKWPNDVHVDGRKIAGILVETQSNGGTGSVEAVVIGVGINVHATSFPSELVERATSLALAFARSTATGGAAAMPSTLPVHRAHVFARLAVALGARMQMLATRGLVALLGEITWLDGLRGKRVTIDGIPATALGIASDGALLTRGTDGIERPYTAGEVTLADRAERS